MSRPKTLPSAMLAQAVLFMALTASAVPVRTSEPAQVTGLDGWNVTPVFTVGEAIDGYYPPGKPDGMGAVERSPGVVRVYLNHELSDGNGYLYDLANGTTLDGARVSFIDLDRSTRTVITGGLAYDTIVDRRGDVVTSATQINEGIGPSPTRNGIDRLCSAWLGLAGQYGLVDDLFFTGEETSSGRGGQEFVLDGPSETLYAVPALGRAAFESVTMVDHPDSSKIAVVIGDDRAGAPFLLFVGEKNFFGSGELLDRNGLATGQGTLYVWVADDGSRRSSDWSGTGTSRSGTFLPLPHYDAGMASTPGYDDLGYMDLAVQDAYAFNTLECFRFSRPEDVSTNPDDGRQVVMASTGNSFALGFDDWGTTYLFDFDFSGPNPTAVARILYDGDDAGSGQFAGPDFGLRSPDNLVWSENGSIYVQEDPSTSLFGSVSGEEASIWELDATTGLLTRIAQVDRTAIPTGQTDIDPTDLGAWETSGIIDVSSLFDTAAGERLLFGTVQAHSLRGGTIGEQGLVQGGQLFFASNPTDIVSVGGDEDPPSPIERTLALDQNVPNPFNPLTEIRFSLAKAQAVRLTIHDARGRHVDTLVDETLDAGEHSLVWDGTDARGVKAPSGQYFYVLRTQWRRLTKSMTLVK